MPTPPVGPPDPRQETFYGITGGLARQLLQDEGAVTTTGTVSGFRASAVDVGQLQEWIEEAIELFDMNQVRERWDVDLRQWIAHSLVSWIQRCKYVHCDLGEKGVTIRIETQDDRGCYTYEFDVFPGRKALPER